MSYASEAAALTRTPITVAIITLDYCAQTFGVAGCGGTGAACYNTYHTCKYKTGYLKSSREYEFSSADAPLPYPGPRPYIKSTTLLPTEITDNMTITGRLKLDLYDEPDTDVGIDPYRSTRSTIQGTFFKKLLARNPNYKGRKVEIYDTFPGLAWYERVQRGLGTIDSIKISKGIVTIEAADGLKKLADIDIPAKLDIKLVTDITADAIAMTLSTLDGLSATGYVRIGDEIIGYAASDAPSNAIQNCTRAAFGTTAQDHTQGSKVDKCRYYPPTNPFDLLKEILSVDCGLASSEYSGTTFDYWRDWPGGDVEFSALITEPTKAEQLYFEICDLLDCASWVGEDLKITIRRNIPNVPDLAYTSITDALHISDSDSSADLNDASRATRVVLYWDKGALAPDEEVGSYGRGDIGIDPDAESVNDYNEELPKTIFCRWLRTGYLQDEVMDGYVKDLVLRRLLNLRDARPIITVSVDLKDASIKTGDYAVLQTDELQTAAGISITERYQVIRREPKGATINLKMQQLGAERICFIAADSAPDYDAASEAQREYGYIGADNTGLIDNMPGYVNW